MGDLIALAFTLFIIGAVTGGFKAGGRLVSILCWCIAGLIMAYAAFVTSLSVIVGIATIISIIGAVVNMIIRHRRRRNYDCGNCCLIMYCDRDCFGRHYTPRNHRR